MPAWKQFPKITADGEKRLSVVYTDEWGRRRTKGGFRERGEPDADRWIVQYRLAEARGKAALAAFLGREVRGGR